MKSNLDRAKELLDKIDHVDVHAVAKLLIETVELWKNNEAAIEQVNDALKNFSELYDWIELEDAEMEYDDSYAMAIPDRLLDAMKKIIDLIEQEIK
jgi:hypothetical protein